jgi:hypothetical protein
MAAEQIYLPAGELGLENSNDLSLTYFGSIWREGDLAKRNSRVCIDERAIGATAAQLPHEICGASGRSTATNNSSFPRPCS